VQQQKEVKNITLLESLEFILFMWTRIDYTIIILKCFIVKIEKIIQLWASDKYKEIPWLQPHKYLEVLQSQYSTIEPAKSNSHYFHLKENHKENKQGCWINY